MNRGGRYDTEELYRAGGTYWYVGGVNIAGVAAWLLGFATYAACAQPLWLQDHASWAIEDVPGWMTEIGGTIPSFVVSLIAYLVFSRIPMPGVATVEPLPDAP